MAITGGSNLNSVPTTQKQTLSTNYLDFTGSSDTTWAQQYLPDLMEKEAEVFGKRTISGFLSQVGAEEAMTSDQVVWSEQSRLHISVKGTVATTGGTESAGTFEVTADIDGNTTGFTLADHGVRVNDLVLISSAGITTMCLATDVDTATIMVEPYDKGTLAGHATTVGGSTLLVVGSEYAKGVSYSAVDTANPLTAADKHEANQPSFKSFSNKPIIMKDYYEVSGSDASRIGWVEVSTEEGGGGYLWYLKAEADTRARFTDYLEMAMLESVVGSNSTVVDASLAAGGITLGDSGVGTQGLFDAITDRGNVTSGVTGVNPATDLAEFDAILAEFDNQGAIEENMMFVNRSTSLAIDDMLASMNSYGAGGTSYGVFDNSEDMALNLGFSGFRRGSYDFYKSDMRYLNDKATRGGINATAGSAAIRGVVVPAGVSSVYDEMLGRNMKRPFLHVRYRASQTDNRRLKTWVTGSVGAATSALDAMQMHFLSERCLITQGANNFMLMK